jgi:putative transposase
MNLVEKQIVKRGDPRYAELMELCHLSKNLYNAALYLVRQHWLDTRNDDTVAKKYLNYYDTWNLMKKGNPDFRALNAHTAQLVLKQVDAAFASFFSLLKLKARGKYAKRVRLPGYLPKDGYNAVSFNQFKVRELKDGYVTLPKAKTLRFRVAHRNVHFINVVPRNGYVQVNFVYRRDPAPRKPDNGRYMGVDLGVDNLATCTSNVRRAFIVDGKPVKHVNQHFNKRISELKDELAKKNGTTTSNRTRSVTLKRNSRINDYFHKASRYIVNQAVSSDIRTIIVGHNRGWKQEACIGRRGNQNFVQIPFDRLISQLKYKGALVGITVIEVEEGYTSKCSFLDGEEIGAHEAYAGRRVKRGLFQTASGRLVNADVNGSYNILRRGVKRNRDAAMPADAGFVYNPVKVRL